ncbi:uncharacterized protein LOC144280617 [Canis aureus]
MPWHGQGPPTRLRHPTHCREPQRTQQGRAPGGEGSAHRFRWSEARPAAVVAEIKLGAEAPAAARGVARAGTGSRGIAGGLHGTRAQPPALGARRLLGRRAQGTPARPRPLPRRANGRGAREARGGARAAGRPTTPCAPRSEPPAPGLQSFGGPPPLPCL